MKVSIIIPVYNGKKTLEKCINSVINQTYQNWELIIVNDLSTDNTHEIIEKYLKKDTRIVYVNKNKNEKTLKARIDGLKKMTGEYFTFLDADDWMHPNAIKSLIENANKTNADVVLGSWQRVFDNYGILKKKPINKYYTEHIDAVFDEKELNENFGLSLFAKHAMPVVTWAKLYKSELKEHFINDNLPNVFIVEDVYFNLLIFQNVKKISFIKDIIIFYRDGGVSHTLNMEYLKHVDFLYQLRKKILENSSKKKQAYIYMNKELANTFFYYFIDCVYTEKFNIEQIKTKYLEIKNYISYQDFISNLNTKEVLHYDFFNSLENDNFENTYQLIKKEISKFRFKRGLRRIIGNLLLKL
jgi:glycosyltransferase involved in cell wall biosynthesis